ALELRLPLDAEPRLQRAGLVVDPRMDDARVVAALVRGDLALLLQDDDPAAAERQRARRREPDEAGPHDGDVRPSHAASLYDRSPGEGAPRDDVLPAGGRRRRPATAEVRDPPAGARHRDARPRAGRPEVDPPRRRAPGADAGVGPPGPLRRPEGAQAGRGAARHAGARALDPARAAPR